MEMTSYTLVTLRRPQTAPEMTSDELAALQERHLNHLWKMRVAEAPLLAEQDPSVQAGRLTVDVMTWWMAKGSWAHAAASEAGAGGSEVGG